MKKNSKKSSQNVVSLAKFQKFEICAKQLAKVKGGGDYIGIEDIING